MKDLFDKKIMDAIGSTKIVTVTVFDKLSYVRPTIEALLKAGLKAIELPLRTPCAIDAIRIVKEEYPEIILGIGTVITPKQVKTVKDIGVDFAVSPGLNRRVIEAAIENKLSFAPGITTASELETALEYNLKFLKFFPAEKIGGLDYLKAMNGPYKHLGIKYLPLGGLNQNNVGQYFKSDLILAIGGSWIAKSSFMEEGNYQQIYENAKNAVSIMKESKQYE